MIPRTPGDKVRGKTDGRNARRAAMSFKEAARQTTHRGIARKSSHPRVRDGLSSLLWFIMVLAWLSIRRKKRKEQARSSPRKESGAGPGPAPESETEDDDDYPVPVRPGDMSRSELYEWHKQNGTLGIYYMMYGLD